jgi:hypothetical protein
MMRPAMTRTAMLATASLFHTTSLVLVLMVVVVVAVLWVVTR